MFLVSLTWISILSTLIFGMVGKASEYESTRIDWISPYFVLTYDHSKCSGQGQAAIDLIIRNATKTLHQKPPSVVHEAALSPDNNCRSYFSWAPYWWPDCCQEVKGSKVSVNNSGAEEIANDSLKKLERSRARDDTGHLAQEVIQLSSKNTSAAKDGCSRGHSTSGEKQAKTDKDCYPEGSQIDPTLIYKKCVYVHRDGIGNPDVQLLPLSRNWVNMTSSVLSNALAYGLTRDEKYADKAVVFIRAYFLDSSTGVMPNLNYGQIVRGPPGAGVGGQNDWSRGTYRGLIEWRHMVHVVNAIVILRACGSKAWSTQDANQMTKWATAYLQWLETADIALRSRDNGNNMSSFYYTQVISLYILLGKIEEAVNQANQYFTGPFMKQIDVDGNQPRESNRTRTLHYLSFGLEGIIVNAKLADSLGLNMWSAKTGNGTTIQDAADYILSIANQAAENDGRVVAEKDDFADLSPHIAAVLTAYGDRPDNRYQEYLSNATITADPHSRRTWRLYDLPCSFYSSPSKGHTISSQIFS